VNKLRQLLERDFNEFLAPLMDLVAIDTQDIGHGIDGGLEKEGQEYLEKFYKNLGADEVLRDHLSESVIQEAIEKHGEGNPGHDYTDRYNLYATFKGGSGKSILFNGHVDTMPPGDISAWQYDPFTPTIEDGRLYGLGVADMKSGLLAPAMAVKLLKNAGIELPGDVILTSVVDEEGGGNGSIQAAMKGIRADAAVVCEPTDRELIVAHMGFVFFDVKVEGKAVHSGSKWLGVSAIDKSIKLIKGLEELEHQWLMTYKHSHLPGPSMNVGVIEGGTAGSTVAKSCSFKSCVHYHPNTMNHESVAKTFKDTIHRNSQGDSWLKDHLPKIEIYQAGGPFEMEINHPFVSSFKQAFYKAMNDEVELVGSPAGCDSRVWRNIVGIPTLQYGPGRQSECHSVDEYIDLEQYKEAILIYAELILAWGNHSEEENKDE